MSDIIIVLIYSGITALATGLGVIPLYFTKNISVSKMSLASALASGLLLAAAFDLINEGTNSNAVLTLLGVIAGATLISMSRKWLDKRKGFYDGFQVVY